LLFLLTSLVQANASKNLVARCALISKYERHEDKRIHFSQRDDCCNVMRKLSLRELRGGEQLGRQCRQAFKGLEE